MLDHRGATTTYVYVPTIIGLIARHWLWVVQRGWLCATTLRHKSNHSRCLSHIHVGLGPYVSSAATTFMETGNNRKDLVDPSVMGVTTERNLRLSISWVQDSSFHIYSQSTKYSVTDVASPESNSLRKQARSIECNEIWCWSDLLVEASNLFWKFKNGSKTIMTWQPRKS